MVLNSAPKATPRASAATGPAGTGWPPISPSISNGHAHRLGEPGIVASPRELTATIAATVPPSSRTIDALPSPPLRLPAVAP